MKLIYFHNGFLRVWICFVHLLCVSSSRNVSVFTCSLCSCSTLGNVSSVSHLRLVVAPPSVYKPGFPLSPSCQLALSSWSTFLVWAVPFCFDLCFLGFEILPVGFVPLPRVLCAWFSGFGLNKDTESCFVPLHRCVCMLLISLQFHKVEGSSELACGS